MGSFPVSSGPESGSKESDQIRVGSDRFCQGKHRIPAQSGTGYDRFRSDPQAGLNRLGTTEKNTLQCRYAQALPYYVGALELYETIELRDEQCILMTKTAVEKIQECIS
jgi:hypothetical protein